MSGVVDQLVVEALADEGAALRARVAELEADVVSYRDLLQRALAHAHDIGETLKRERATSARLREELRRYTAARQEAAA